MRTSIGLSAKKHIPLLKTPLGEYYFWDVPKYATERYVNGQFCTKINKCKFRFSPIRMRLIHREWNTWLKLYTPTTFSTHDNPLILDAGAGEGETLLFYYMLGFHRFRCVELDEESVKLLKVNALKLCNAEVEICNRQFEPFDLDGIDFAKIDVEGGEYKLIGATKLPREMVLEIHSKEIEQLIRRQFPDMTLLMRLSGEVSTWHWVNKSRR